MILTFAAATDRNDDECAALIGEEPSTRSVAKVGDGWSVAAWPEPAAPHVVVLGSGGAPQR